ncbi:hypothetical protein CBW22_19065 [Pantoea sp. VS1]|nr:hypothetical protein [Pantoea sp. Cy-640]OWS74458.1 hypothetical protein CBW22_19065 [Pantoea sp. VS1]
MPVIHDEVERQQREEIRYYLQECRHYPGYVDYLTAQAVHT